MNPYYQDKDVTVYNGDVLAVLQELPSESVDCCITSPPYWGLRDYGTGTWEGGDPACDHKVRKDAQIESSTLSSGRSTTGHQKEGFKISCPRCGARRIDLQIGLETTPEEYVAKMVKVFREVRRVLKKEGTCWLNLGDSYNGIGGDHKEGGKNDASFQTGIMHGIQYKNITALKPKDIVGTPWRVAFALQADGWWLRQDIIWSKPNPMPESVTDRCTKSHEYIFLLTKSAKYYYDQQAILEPIAESTIGRGPVDFGGAKGRGYKEGMDPSDPNYRNGSEQWGRTYDYQKSSRKMNGENAKIGGNGTGFQGHSGNYDANGNLLGNPLGRNKRSVWEITTKPYKAAHFATFPPDLVQPMVMAGCPVNGLVLDPFAGSGTTLQVAKHLGRHAIGIEIKDTYCELIIDRCRQQVMDLGGECI